MSTVKEVTTFYDLILSSPGMEDFVKLDNKISCRMSFLMVMAIEQAISGNDPGNVFKKILSEEDLSMLTNISGEILKKAKLETIYLKMKELSK